MGPPSDRMPGCPVDEPHRTYQAVLPWAVPSRWQSSSRLCAALAASSGDSWLPGSDSCGIFHTAAQVRTLLSKAVQQRAVSAVCTCGHTAASVPPCSQGRRHPAPLPGPPSPRQRSQGHWYPAQRCRQRPGQRGGGPGSAGRNARRALNPLSLGATPSLCSRKKLLSSKLTPLFLLNSSSKTRAKLTWGCNEQAWAHLRSASVGFCPGFGTASGTRTEHPEHAVREQSPWATGPHPQRWRVCGRQACGLRPMSHSLTPWPTGREQPVPDGDAIHCTTCYAPCARSVSYKPRRPPTHSRWGLLSEPSQGPEPLALRCS